MDALTTMFSISGRLAPKPFMLGAVVVYVGGFLSQLLLNSQVTQHANVIPFVLVQIALAWTWYALHANRLRDAGRGVGAAIALTIVYLLAIVLLLVVVFTVNKGVLPADNSGFAVQTIIAVLAAAFITSLIVGASSAIGMFGPALLGGLVAITLPVLIGFVFTIWLVSRPRAPLPPSPPP
jgi:uncharacterized membrane protein YhaH (DUF805 family)